MKKESIIVATLIGLFILSVVIGGLGVSINDPTKTKEGPLSSRSILKQDGIALIEVLGPIGVGSSSHLTPGSADAIINELYDIAEDNIIKAVVIRINSPGGTVGSSQEIYYELVKFRKKTELPVIASIADVGASGAYWVALGCDFIFSNPGSMVGNIGVIIQNYDLTEISEKFGIKLNTYKSGPYKDLLSSFRDTKPEERQIIQSMITDVHTQFIQAVANSRNLSEENARKLADGRIFSGLQAKDVGLIDEIGGLHDALKYAQETAGLSDGYEVYSKFKLNPMVQFMKYIRRNSQIELSLPFLKESY